MFRWRGSCMPWKQPFASLRETYFALLPLAKGSASKAHPLKAPAQDAGVLSSSLTTARERSHMINEEKITQSPRRREGTAYVDANSVKFSIQIFSNLISEFQSQGARSGAWRPHAVHCRSSMHLHTFGSVLWVIDRCQVRTKAYIVSSNVLLDMRRLRPSFPKAACIKRMWRRKADVVRWALLRHEVWRTENNYNNYPSHHFAYPLVSCTLYISYSKQSLNLYFVVTL